MKAIGRGILQILEWLEGAAVVVASLLLLTMSGIITASVLGRQLFLKPIPDELRLVGLLTVGVIALPLAFVERQQGHIAVSVTTDWMGVRAKGALRAFGAFAMAVFFSGVGYMVSSRLPREIARGTYYDGPLQLPTWPMKVVFAFGITLLVCRLCVSIWQGISTAITGVELGLSVNDPVKPSETDKD